jgi:hypothetical protein
MSAALDVAAVFRDGEAAFLARYGRTLRSEQRQALRAVIRCRTAELGGHVQRCEACGQQRIQYNSCRNRHCPKCQALARAAWLQKRESELLPVPYFHVVFTLPHELAPLALQNPRVLYGILFQAAARTLMEVAADPRHLGARVGCLIVLHTWGQNLMHHPHVHAIVTGGGLSLDGSRWIYGKRSKRRRPYFAPVEVLSRVFRGKFIHLLKQAFASGKLAFHGQLQPLRDPAAFEQRLNHAVRHDWVVYAKRPFSSPTCVLKYLARYTHGVAISNRRLVALHDGQVSFRYKDYADHQQSKILTLQTPEFIRRFLLHTLPRSFVRIRYYGFLANRQRNERLDHCRRLLGVTAEPTPVAEEKVLPTETLPPQELCRKCPACQHGKLVIIEVVPPLPRLQPRRPHILTSGAAFAQPLDSS